MADQSAFLRRLMDRVARATWELQKNGARWEPQEWQLLMHPNAWDELIRCLRYYDGLEPIPQPSGELRFMGIPVVLDPSTEGRVVLRFEIAL